MKKDRDARFFLLRGWGSLKVYRTEVEYRIMN